MKLNNFSMLSNHTGWLVSDISEAIKAFQAIGFEIFQDTTYDQYRDIDICFIKNNTGQTIELISPKSEKSIVFSLLKKQGPGPYHICLCTNDENITDILKKAKFICISKKQKAPAIENKEVAFFYNKHIGIVEICFSN